MSRASRMLRPMLALAAFVFAVTIAAPSIAGDRGGGGTCDEAQPKPKSAPGVEASSASAPQQARREASLPVPSDDGYLPLARGAQPSGSPGARPADPAAPVPPTGAARTEEPRPATRKAVAPATNHHARKRTGPHAKISIPNLPAQPGMGTLLRVGITAGREIS